MVAMLAGQIAGIAQDPSAEFGPALVKVGAVFEGFL
jgi:hypothetical protein